MSLCQGCEISYLSSKEYSDEEVVSFLLNHGVASSYLKCPECGWKITLKNNREVFRCCGFKNKARKTRCTFFKSVWSDTFFHCSQLTKSKVFRLVSAIVWLLPSPRNLAVKQELAVQQEVCLLRDDWFLPLREVFIHAVCQNSEKLGGQNQVVELADAKWKTKNLKESPWDWAFGGIDRQSGETFLTPVKYHSVESLIEIIGEKINPGTIIVTRCTTILTSNEIEHLSNIFSVTFESPDLSKLFNIIKYHWSEVCEDELFTSLSNVNPSPSIDQLAEYLFKSKHPVRAERLHAFFVAAGSLYPPGDKQMIESHPYHCDKCGRKYKYTESLSRHRNHECGVEPRFFCSYCDYKSTQRCNLSKHMLNKHSRKLAKE